MKIDATARGTQVADTNMKHTLNNDTELEKRRTNIIVANYRVDALREFYTCRCTNNVLR